jgi:hypothetical protein
MNDDVTERESETNRRRLLRERPTRVFRARIGTLDCFNRKDRCSCGRRWRSDAGPMLINGLWKRIAKKAELLCDRCVRKRLGRPYRVYWDFRACPFNHEYMLIDLREWVTVAGWRGSYLLRSNNQTILSEPDDGHVPGE